MMGRKSKYPLYYIYDLKLFETIFVYTLVKNWSSSELLLNAHKLTYLVCYFDKFYFIHFDKLCLQDLIFMQVCLPFTDKLVVPNKICLLLYNHTVIVLGQADRKERKIIRIIVHESLYRCYDLEIFRHVYRLEYVSP